MSSDKIPRKQLLAEYRMNYVTVNKCQPILYEKWSDDDLLHAVEEQIEKLQVFDCQLELLVENQVPQHKEIITTIEETVKRYMSKNDGSHNFDHINRVRKQARSLAIIDGYRSHTMRLFLIDLIALLHDVKDRKYVGDVAYSWPDILKATGLSEFIISRIMTSISKVSYANKLKVEGNNNDHYYVIETMYVSDSDLLDAIGFIGICRCLCYAGAKSNLIYDSTTDYPRDINIEEKKDLTHEEYINNPKTDALQHFEDKLLTLKKYIVTKHAKVLAEERTQVLIHFRKGLLNELGIGEGVAPPKPRFL